MLIKINEVKTYTFSEFKEIQENREIISKYNIEDIKQLDKIIGHIKKNKVMYGRLVFMTALFLHLNINVFASGFETVGPVIIDKFLSLMKWGCIGRGLYEMTVTMVSGGNIKKAMTEGIQYWIGFLFLQFYPQLYDIFAGIKF